MFERLRLLYRLVCNFNLGEQTADSRNLELDLRHALSMKPDTVIFSIAERRLINRIKAKAGFICTPTETAKLVGFP